MVLDNLGKALNNALKRVLGASVVDEKLVNELVRDLQRALLTADVEVSLVMKISEEVRKRALEQKLPRGVSRREHVVKVVYDSLAQILGEKPKQLNITPGQFNLIMLIGIQGSGKTTTAAKLARYYQKRGLKVGLICADTFRPGAYEQLKQLAERTNIPFYGNPKEKNPVKIAKKGVEEFKKQKIELVFLDTSGRHKEEKGLLKEMKDIAKAVNPREIILVIDGTLGQQAYAQASAFMQATPIGSIIVTKLDGSARGGGALSAVAATGAPIKFIGTGEDINEIEPFVPTKFVGRLLGMADLKGLIEKVKEAEIESDEELAKAFMTGKFNLKDMLKQMKAMRKLGPLGKILEMMGLKYQISDADKAITEERMNAWENIIQSMTKEEMEDPKILNQSRVLRIAKGSGHSQREVKELVKQYELMKKTIKKIGKQRGMKIPGMRIPRKMR